MPSKPSTLGIAFASMISVVLLVGCGAATSGAGAPVRANAPGAMGPAGPAPAEASESAQEGSPAGEASGETASEEPAAPSEDASASPSSGGAGKVKVNKFVDVDPDTISKDFLPAVGAMEELIGARLVNPDDPLWSPNRYNQMTSVQAAYSTADYTAEKESPFGIGVGITSGPTYDYVLEEFQKVNWEFLEEKDGITYLTIKSVIPSAEGQLDYIVVSAFLPVNGYLANGSCTWTAPQGTEIEMGKIVTCASGLAKLVAKKPV